MDRDRLKRIRNYQSTDFYPALVIRPISIAIMWVIADWKVVTPNRLTHLGNLAKLGCAATLIAAVDSDAYRWLAIALLHLGIIADNLDGTLARYRRSFSGFGSFYDKASDLITWFPIAAALGWLAYAQLGDPIMLILATTHAYALGSLGYMKWVAHAETQRLLWHQARDNPDIIDHQTRPPKLTEPPDRTPAQWIRWAAWSAAQIVRFEEMDLVFWISLGLILDRLDLLLWLLAITQSIGALIMFAKRGRDVWRADQSLALMANGTDKGPLPSGNQADYWREKLRAQIDRVKREMASGLPASEIAGRLLDEDGLGTIQIIAVFREATGAKLGDLKSFGQWWDRETGVTDVEAFDAWAAEVFKNPQ